MTFHCDGDILAVGEGQEGEEKWWGWVRLWSVSTGQQLGVMERHAGDVTCIAFDSTTQTLAVAGEDGKIRLWRLLREPAHVRLTAIARGWARSRTCTMAGC
jgi:WD40 repeat protein